MGDPTESFLCFFDCWLIFIKGNVHGVSVLNAVVETIFVFYFFFKLCVLHASVECTCLCVTRGTCAQSLGVCAQHVGICSLA